MTLIVSGWAPIASVSIAVVVDSRESGLDL
jgi:hypothetical protein